jgi:hypothetical protein
MLAAIQWQRCRSVIGLGTDSKPIAVNDAGTAPSADLPQ